MDQTHIEDQSLPLLSISKLSLEFRQEDGSYRRVVNEASFDVYRGEVLGVVGESGSGKTLTCLSIMQLLPPAGKIQNGSILFRGNGPVTDLVKLDEDRLQKIRGKQISMIFQEPMSSLNPGQKCGHQVGEMIQIHHPSLSKAQVKVQVLDLFRKVKLTEVDRIYASYVHQLSGGQLQRVMIAMAVANKPALIIADEPTTALDVTVQQSILDLLLELKQEFGCSIIFISHDLGVIKKIANRVVVMQKGNVVETGPVEQVFYHPEHLYTKALIACRPPLDVRLKRLPTVRDFIDAGEEQNTDFKNKYAISTKEYQERQAILQTREDILTVQDLTKWYPKKKSFFGTVLEKTMAVNEVSFSLKKGETLGLVGESGCGKSTLGKTILRLIPPSAGKVIYNGNDIFDLSDEKMRRMRRHMQIIFQDPYSALNPRMRIGDAIKEPMVVHKLYQGDEERKERVMELLDIVGMAREHYDRYPHQFSGGQRQRINIARTLSLQPDFIVCDESVSALDVSVQAQVLNLLMDLKERFGLSYLFISHDISVIKHISDRIMVMEKGIIVETGDAEQVYHDPQNEYTKRLISAVPT